MDKPQVDSHRRHSARDRHRPDQSGAHLALDRRHDDRAQRSPEAAVSRAPRSCIAAAAARRCGATRRRRIYARAERARGAGRGDPRLRRHVPGAGAGELHRRPKCTQLLEAAGLHAHPRAARRRRSKSCRTGCASAAPSASRVIRSLAFHGRARARDRSARSGAARRQGRVDVHVARRRSRAPPTRVWRFSSDLHCADCDIHYREPTPSLFSFNSPLGACETCRGFGRVIGIDFGLDRSGRSEDAARAARSSRGRPRRYQRMPGRPRADTRASAAFRSTCRGAS